MTRAHRIQYMHESIAIEAEVFGVDTWLDNLESILRALSQRRMTPDQLDRYALLLEGAEADALRRTGRRLRVAK